MRDYYVPPATPWHGWINVYKARARKKRARPKGDAEAGGFVMRPTLKFPLV